MATDGFSPRLKAFFSGSWYQSQPNTIHLGEFHRDIDYTVVNSRWLRESKAELKLHDGATTHSPIIGRVMKPTDPNHPCLTIWFSITIPAYLSAGKDQTRVAMQPNSLTHTRFTFKMKVGKPGKQQTERFEWRMSKGDEVHHIHPKAHGAKLVRLGHEGPGGGAGGERGTRKKGESSDGKEVVAVWGTTSHVPRTVTGEYKKPFTLYFRGSGDTGELGEEFRALAIMSALKIFQLTEQKM